MSKDSKKVNATTLNFLMRIGILKLRRELREQFDKFPEDPNGVEVFYSDFEEKFNLLTADGITYVKELLGDMPDISDDELDAEAEAEAEEEENSSGYNSIYVVKNIRTLGNRTWERFGETTNQPGSIFGENITVKWPECGAELFVPNGAFDYAPHGSNGAAWICGTMSAKHESQGQTGGVWGPVGCKATYYEIHYNK